MSTSMKQEFTNEVQLQARSKTSPRCWRARAGFSVLGSFVITLYVFIVFEAWVLHSIGGIVAAIILAGVLLALFQEGRCLKRIENSPVSLRHMLISFVATVAGAWATYWISEHLNLGPVAGSALVGLMGALIIPAYAVPIYCGSFVGMSSAALLAGLPEMLLAGGICGLVFVLAEDTLNGLGGKLGTIAFSGALLTGLGLQRQFLITPVPGFDLAWQIILWATLAAIFTYWLSMTLKHGPVLASSAVGLMGGLLLPALFPENGGLLAVVVICASFTGMSSSKRFASPWPMVAAGLITGFIFLYSLPVFGGTGGKLGTIAFGASLAVWGYQITYARWKAGKQAVH